MVSTLVFNYSNSLDIVVYCNVSWRRVMLMLHRIVISRDAALGRFDLIIEASDLERILKFLTKRVHPTEIFTWIVKTGHRGFRELSKVYDNKS